MSRPPLWLCRNCKRPLGQITAGALDIFGPSKAERGHVVVTCVCGAVRIWYDDPDPERDRLAEFARTSH